MNTQTIRAKYQAPKLEVQRLRELPPALAKSGSCHVTPSKGLAVSCSTPGAGGQSDH